VSDDSKVGRESGPQDERDAPGAHAIVCVVRDGGAAALRWM